MGIEKLTPQLHAMAALASLAEETLDDADVFAAAFAMWRYIDPESAGKFDYMVSYGPKAGIEVAVSLDRDGCLSAVTCSPPNFDVYGAVARQNRPPVRYEMHGDAPQAVFDRIRLILEEATE